MMGKDRPMNSPNNQDLGIIRVSRATRTRDKVYEHERHQMAAIFHECRLLSMVSGAKFHRLFMCIFSQSTRDPWAVTVDPCLQRLELFHHRKWLPVYALDGMVGVQINVADK